jgi:hypothetical protein
MRTARYYQVRTAVRVVFWTALIGGTLTAIMFGVDHLNWMGDHYCFHSMMQCYFGGK